MKQKGPIVKHGCVILADKHQDMLEGIRGLLETMFETVVMVADADSLFESTQKLKPDLAVVDLSLPVFGEINVVRALKDRFPDLRFIILSVHDEPMVVKEVMAVGSVGFVLKRSAATDLIPAAKKVLKGSTYISPTERV